MSKPCCVPVPIPVMPGSCLCLFPPLEPYIPYSILFSCFILTTGYFGSDFPQWPQTYLVPALQPATVSSSSPYCIRPPKFLFLSPPHCPPIPPSSAACTLSPLCCRQIWNKKSSHLPPLYCHAHQRLRNCLYEHASSIPVQNKTNQFSQKVKLSSPRCHEGTGCYRVPAIGPAEDHHSSVVPAGSLSAWVHKTGVSEGPLTMLLHSRGFSFPSESGFF